MTTLATQIKEAHIDRDEDGNYAIIDEVALSDVLVKEAVDWYDDWEAGSRTYILKDGSKLIQKGGELIVLSIAAELFNAYEASKSWESLDAALERHAMEIEDTERGTEHIFTDTSRIVTRGKAVYFVNLV